MTDRDEEWARELWPDEDEYWPPPPHQVDMGTPPQPPSPEGRRVLLRLVTIAVVALAAGTGGALAAKDLTTGSTPPAAATQPNESGGAVPAPGSGQPRQETSGAIEIGGKVTAVSPRSITITAGPQSVTARVTGSTRFSGRVKRISGVRVGDLVFAQISADNGVNSLVTLQDPYSAS